MQAKFKKKMFSKERWAAQKADEVGGMGGVKRRKEKSYNLKGGHLEQTTKG